jgi:hypothetical protein
MLAFVFVSVTHAPRGRAMCVGTCRPALQQQCQRCCVLHSVWASHCSACPVRPHSRRRSDAQGHVVEVSSDAHDIACGQAVAQEERTLQETVVGLLREHLSHQLASEDKPPQLSEAPNVAEVHNRCGMCG